MIEINILYINSNLKKLFKVSSAWGMSNWNAFKIAPCSLSPVEVPFGNALDASAGKQFVVYRLKIFCSKSAVKYLNKVLAIFNLTQKALEQGHSGFLIVNIKQIEDLT